MELSPVLPEQQITPKQAEHGPTLQVDFSWKKFKALITSKDDKNSKPLYIVNFRAFSPHLVFEIASDKSTFGTGTLHAISIDADCDLRGRHIKLKALKRFKTSYTHLSHAYSDTEDPVPMTWTTDCNLKTWDFICLDGNQLPVAKFSANIWALKAIGNIDFMGPKAGSQEVRDEIVVTGLTLFYCMALRTNSVLSLFGALIAKPGHLEKES